MVVFPRGVCEDVNHSLETISSYSRLSKLFFRDVVVASSRDYSIRTSMVKHDLGIPPTPFPSKTVSARFKLTASIFDALALLVTPSPWSIVLGLLLLLLLLTMMQAANRR